MGPGVDTASLPSKLPQIPELPKLPIPSSQFIKHVNGNPQVPDNALRAFYSRMPDYEIVRDNTINLVDVFAVENQ